MFLFFWFLVSFLFWLHLKLKVLMHWGSSVIYKKNKFYYIVYVATLALGSQPRQGLARVQAKKKAWESHLFHAPGSVGECEGMNPHPPKWAPILGIGVPMDSKFSDNNRKGQNPLDWEFLISLKISWKVDV